MNLEPSYIQEHVSIYLYIFMRILSNQHIFGATRSSTNIGTAMSESVGGFPVNFRLLLVRETYLQTNECIPLNTCNIFNRYGTGCGKGLELARLCFRRIRHLKIEDAGFSLFFFWVNILFAFSVMEYPSTEFVEMDQLLKEPSGLKELKRRRA